MQVLLILLIILAIVLIPTILLNLGAGYLMRRRRPDPPDLPDQHGIAFEEVAFVSRDGLALVGWWIPAHAENGEARGTIVLCHGQDGSMDRDTRRMIPLHAAGFNVLMFDFRAHGRSGGNQVTMGIYEKEDLLGALDYLETARGITGVGVLGFSMGAAVAIITAALTDRIAALVVDSPFARLTYTVAAWGRLHGLPMPIAREIARWVLVYATIRAKGRIDQVDPLRWVQHIPSRPILFIFGTRDPFITRRHAHQLPKLNSGPTDLWMVKGVGHRGAYDADPEAYNRRVVGWFTEWLPVPAAVPIITAKSGGIQTVENDGRPFTP